MEMDLKAKRILTVYEGCLLNLQKKYGEKS